MKKYQTEEDGKAGRLIRISNPAYYRLKLLQLATGASMKALVDRAMPYLMEDVGEGEEQKDV
jgi:hypothetical protein